MILILNRFVLPASADRSIPSFTPSLITRENEVASSHTMQRVKLTSVDTQRAHAVGPKGVSKSEGYRAELNKGKSTQVGDCT
jgi:hypothetical protein